MVQVPRPGLKIPSEGAVSIGMATELVTRGGIKMTVEAASVIDEVGMADESIRRDVDQIRRERISRSGLVAVCLDGACEGHLQGWRAYVDAVCEAAATRKK